MKSENKTNNFEKVEAALYANSYTFDPMRRIVLNSSLVIALNIIDDFIEKSKLKPETLEKVLTVQKHLFRIEKTFDECFRGGSIALSAFYTASTRIDELEKKVIELEAEKAKLNKMLEFQQQ